MSMDGRTIEDHPNGFKDNVVRCFRKYVDGNGRARRREYWWFALFQILVLAAPTIIGLMVGAATGEDETSPAVAAVGVLFIVVGIVYLGLIIPSITVLIRRFHDVGLSGWLILLGIVPVVGGLFTFVVSLLPSQPYPNKHGPVPGQAIQSAADVFG